MSRRLEELRPLQPGRVTIYTCGPTVYDRAHIGNFRTFLWEDLLRRYLRWKGYQVTQVMNLTDVDDRTINAALESGADLAATTGPVIEAFAEDWGTLGLEEPEYRPRATEHVDGMVSLVERLTERGLAYERDGSVYFAIGRQAGYGQLAGIDLSAGPAPVGAQRAFEAAADEEYDKEDARDFVLWKGGARGEQAAGAVWDSPWGPGRPGWHLECSAMAMEYLGDTLDIHAGGVDNLFPHHTNEIAQSEGATGKIFARMWLHAAHLQVEGEKMSKSLGNCYTIPDLLDRGLKPSSLRYLLLSGHYRTRLNFTFAGVEAAAKSVDRIHQLRRRVREALDAATGKDESPPGATSALEEAVARARRDFETAMDDDLNVSQALAAVFGVVREANQALTAAGSGDSRAAELRATLAFLDDFDRVWGVLALRDSEGTETDGDLEAWAVARAEARLKARADRDWATADAIREELQARGIAVEDSLGGTRMLIGSNTVTVAAGD